MSFNIYSLIFIHRKRFSFSSLCNYFYLIKIELLASFLFFFFCSVLDSYSCCYPNHPSCGHWGLFRLAPGYFRCIPVTFKINSSLSGTRRLLWVFFSCLRPGIGIFLRNPSFLAHLCALVTRPQPAVSFTSFRVSPPIFIFQNLDNNLLTIPSHSFLSKKKWIIGIYYYYFFT